MPEIKEFKFQLKNDDFGFNRELKDAKVTYKHTTGNKVYIDAAKEVGLTKVDIQNVENFNTEFTRKFINDVVSPIIEKEFKGDKTLKCVEVSGPIGTKDKNALTVSGRPGKMPEGAVGINGKPIENKEFLRLELNNRKMIGVTVDEVRKLSKELKSKIDDK
jgi:hypothetical protein